MFFNILFRVQLPKCRRIFVLCEWSTNLLNYVIMTKKETTVAASNEAPATVKDTKTLLAEALHCGNFKEVSRLALQAANEEKLAKLAAAEAAKKAAKEAEKAEVATKVTELVGQLMNGEFETFAGLWTIIRTTLPPVTKNAKVPSATNGRTATNGRKTKRQLTDDLLAAGPCTLGFSDRNPEQPLQHKYTRLPLFCSY